MRFPYFVTLFLLFLFLFFFGDDTWMRRRSWSTVWRHFIFRKALWKRLPLQPFTLSKVIQSQSLARFVLKEPSNDSTAVSRNKIRHQVLSFDNEFFQ